MTFLDHVPSRRKLRQLISLRHMTIVLSSHCSDKEKRAGEGEIVCERI